MEYLKKSEVAPVKIAKKMKTNGIIAKVSIEKIKEIFGGESWESLKIKNLKSHEVIKFINLNINF